MLQKLTKFFWLKFIKYLLLGFSAMLILAFFVNNKPAEFIKKGPDLVSAEVNGLGVTFQSSFANPLPATVYNDVGSSFDAGELPVELVQYHCSLKDGTWCDGNSLDHLADDKKTSSVFLNVPTRGSPGVSQSFSVTPFSCGRIQVDLVYNEKIIGGQVYSFDSSCPGIPPPPPPPPPPPNPCPNGAPAAPQGLRIEGSLEPGGARDITFRWDSVVGDNIVYSFWLDDTSTTGAGKTPDVEPRDINGTSITISLSNPTTYNWAVKAKSAVCGESGESQNSFSIKAAPPPPCDVAVPGQPSGFNYNPGNKTLSWNAGSNASFYNVRLVSPNGTQYNHDNVSNVWFTFPDSEVSAFGNYTGWVDAVNNCGTSSGVYSFTINSPPPPPPPPPPPVSVVPACNSLSVSPSSVSVGSDVIITSNISGYENVGIITYMFSNSLGDNSSDQNWTDIRTISNPTSNTQSITYNIPSTTAGSHSFAIKLTNKQGQIIPTATMTNGSCRATAVISTPTQGTPFCTISAPSSVNSGTSNSYSINYNPNNSGRSASQYFVNFGDNTGEQSLGSSNSTTHIYTLPSGSSDQSYNINARVIDSSGQSVFCPAFVTLVQQPRPNLSISKFVIYNGSEYSTLDPAIKKFRAGEIVNFRIRVVNNSQVTADNVAITDNLPGYLINPISSDGGSSSGSTISWQVGSLNGNSEQSRFFSGTVSSSLPSGDTIQNNTAYVSARNINGSPQASATYTITKDAPTPTIDINVTKSTSTPSINIGDSARFTISLHNNSGVDLTGITVTDTLPNGFSYINGSTTGSTTTDPVVSNNTTLTWSNISMAVNADWSVSFRTNTPPTPNTYTNSAIASVQGRNFGPGFANVEIKAPVVPPPPPASLTLDKLVFYLGSEFQNLSSTVNKFRVGDEVGFRIKVINTSTVIARNVVLNDTLPAFLEPKNVGSGFAANKQIVWNLGNLNPGETKTVDFTTTVVSGMPIGDTTQANAVTATSDNADSRSDTASVVVLREAARVITVPFSIEKNPATQTINQGEVATFILKLRNSSGHTISNIQVVDSLPTDFIYVKGSTFGSTTSDPAIIGNTLTWAGISMVDNSEWTISFKATSPNRAGSFVNQATALAEGITYGPVFANVLVSAPASIPSGGTTPAPVIINNPPQVINNYTTFGNVGVGTSYYANLTVLPKTGLPEMALGSLAFIPMGLTLARYKMQKEVLTGFAKSVWKNRMFSIKYPAE